MFSGYRLDGSSPLKRDGKPLAGRFFQQSSWATHAVALGRQLVKVPDHLDHDLFGPLGCSISTGAGAVMNELKPHPGASIAIFGAGAVGLAAVMAARLSPATTIIAIDTEEHRLRLAKELGATRTMLSGSDVVEEVKAATGGGVDYAIECTDGSNLVAQAVQSLHILGVAAMVGGASATATVKLRHADTMLQGKRLVGVLGGGGEPSFLLSLMELQAQGRFPLEKLVRRYPFAEIQAAIDDSDSGAVVKPILSMAA